MSNNLLDVLKEYVTPSLIAKASTTLGESDTAVAKAIGAILPTIMAGLSEKSTDNNGISSIFNLIADPKNNGTALNNLPGLVGGGNLAHNDPKDMGGNFLGAIFGDKMGNVISLIASFAGIKNASASALMGLGGPLVMSVLGKKVADEGLGVTSFSSMLSDHKERFAAAAPVGLPAALSATNFSATQNNPSTSKNTASADKHTEENDSLLGKIWPWLLGALLLLSAWYIFRGCNKKTDTQAVVIDTTANTTPTDNASNIADSLVNAGNANLDTTTTVVDNVVATLGDFFKRKLSTGIELNIPQNGVENKLITFIEDKTKNVDKTTWFSFDRLKFETGKAILKPESKEQLQNIAELLKAYPQVELKLGGYSDSIGNKAANLKLSAQRANSVLDQLVQMGIDTKRLAAEGYGDQFPVADNATAEGREKNRRIDVRVTKK